MKTSVAGRALIVAREGRRLVAYRDTEGILTIGVGHTGRMAPPKVTPGMRITEDQCDAFLAADLAPVEKVLNDTIDVPMTQNEFDAMASLGFNIGVGGLKRSTVIKRLNLGDVAGAAAAFMFWCKPAVLRGRRIAERKQFLTPDAPRPNKESPRQAVASARADVLTQKAEAAAYQAKATKSATAGIAVAGAVTAAATASHHHGFAVGAIILVIVAAVVGTVIDQARKARAETLTKNAREHAAAVEVMPS